MTVYGVYVCYLMLRRPEDLAVEENHVSWAHMYRMMFVAQIGFAARLPSLSWSDLPAVLTSSRGARSMMAKK